MNVLRWAFIFLAASSLCKLPANAYRIVAQATDGRGLATAVGAGGAVARRAAARLAALYGVPVLADSFETLVEPAMASVEPGRPAVFSYWLTVPPSRTDWTLGSIEVRVLERPEGDTKQNLVITAHLSPSAWADRGAAIEAAMPASARAARLAEAMLERARAHRIMSLSAQASQPYSLRAAFPFGGGVLNAISFSVQEGDARLGRPRERRSALGAVFGHAPVGGGRIVVLGFDGLDQAPTPLIALSDRDFADFVANLEASQWPIEGLRPDPSAFAAELLGMGGVRLRCEGAVARQLGEG